MKKEPLVDNQFMKSITEIIDAYIQLDTDGKAWTKKMINHIKGVILDEIKAGNTKQSSTQGSSQSRDNVIVFPGCSQEAYKE